MGEGPPAQRGDEPHDRGAPPTPGIDALLELTEQLSAATRHEDVARVIATTGVQRMGASAGFVVVATADGTGLQMLSHVRPGTPEERLCRFDHQEQLPVVEAWRSGLPVLVPDAEELYRRYPGMDPARPERAAVAAVPLEVDGLRMGAINLTFAAPQDFAPVQRQALRVLASLCAQALRRAELAREVEQVRREFTFTASHELRTPLTAIYGAATALSSGMDVPVDARRQLMGIVVSQSERMIRLLDDLHLTTQIDADDFSCTLAPVDLRREVLDALLTEHEALPGGSGRLLLDVAEPLPAVQGDAARLRQLVSHLVDNACKYSPARSRVRLKVEPAGAAVLLQVLDSGRGLTGPDRAHAFEKFYRGDAMQRDGVSGTGLGLYVSRGIADAMGARLWLEPRADGPGLAACLLLQVAGG